MSEHVAQGARAAFLVGVQGSGKSTFAKTLNATVVSSDEIRAALTGNQADLSREQEVWEELWGRVARVLLGGGEVVIDATNTNPERRATDAARCRELGALTVNAYWVDVPLERCKSQNAARPNPVPEADLVRMHERILAHPPTAGQGGLDQVFRITPEVIG